MINLKINPAKISQRSRNILEAPAFFWPNSMQKFNLEMDSGDKILTVFHSGNPADLEFLLEDVLCLFAKNKRLGDLFKLNIREIENFLRDENHLPATDFSHEILESTLKSSIISLVACGIKTKLSARISVLLAELESWSELSLVEKNRWAQELFGVLSCQLILSEGTHITLAEVPAGVEERQLEELLIEIFGEGAKQLSVKVVAV